MFSKRQSPRLRRLQNDFKAMEQLRHESSIIDFNYEGRPADNYQVRFAGRGFWRPDANSEVQLRHLHHVTIRLGASYPRMMPELHWRTPIFHPNISAGGVVCLGGYGTHWVPSLSLETLCVMLWDMIRYENYDTESPYNREAAQWARVQSEYLLPIDPRPLRDKIEGAAKLTGASGKQSPAANRASASSPFAASEPRPMEATSVSSSEVTFLGDVIDAELVEDDIADSDDSDIIFIQ